MGSPGDSDGTFGGNGSVCWKIKVKNVKGNPKNEKGPDGEHYQEGHDGTPSNSDFRVTIRNVVDRQAVAASMHAAAERVAATGTGVFILPVIKHSHDQIEIKWASQEETFVPAI